MTPHLCMTHTFISISHTLKRKRMSLTSLERFFINVPYSHNGVEMGSICPVNNIEGASVITMCYLCWKEEVLNATSITEKKTVSMG